MKLHNKNRLLFLISIFICHLFSCQIPNNGLLVWLKSDSVTVTSSNDLITWNDLSINGFDFSQSNSTFQPKLIDSIYKLNYHNSVRFDGLNDFISSEFGTSFNSPNTYFIIHNNTKNSIWGSGVFDGLYDNFRNTFMWITQGGVGRTLARTEWAPSSTIRYNKNQPYDYCLNTVEFNSTNSKIYENSILKVTGSMNSQPINSLQIGRKTNNIPNYLMGDVVEFIVYNQILTQNDRLSVENYLMNKYAPEVDLGPDININYGFCDTVISSQNYYSSYLWSNGSSDSAITINQAGLYWLEATDIFGRTSRDSIVIFRPPNDEIQLQNQLVCFNESDTITANLPQGNYSFIQWNNGSTNPTRVLNQNELISYTVIDSLGCIGTSNTATVSIDNSLQNISLGIDTSLCSGNSIQLIQYTSLISSWLWNTQDTTTTLSIDTSGMYILDVSNINGCQNSDTIEVTVIGTAPSLSYSIENEVCQASPLNFSENSTVPPGNTINEVVWNFGELDSVFVSSGAQIFIDSGVYNGFLEVSTLEGCSSKANFDISVHPKPIATFETTNYCPYEDIIFEASNEYAVPLNLFNWNFDQDGNTSNEVSPSYNFSIAGNYNVELIAIDSNQCADTVIQAVFIQPAPVADISILNPCEDGVWELTDNSSIADTFEITTYEWNYGDGTDSINPVQGKFYENYGDYTVQLILTADNGCMDTSAQNLTVHPNPIINYQIGPACKNTWTKFENLSTIPQGSLAETNWLFNLQFEDSATNTSFNFPTTGIQLITLTSTSDEGCVIDTTFAVDVNEELNANFNVDPEILVSDVPITFENTSIGADSSFWDFGDESGINFNNNIENTITYSSLLNEAYVDIVLMTVNDFGCRDTINKTLLVNEAFYDINLKTLFAQDINGFLTVGVEIANLGTIPLENLNLTLKTPENGPIQENWSGSILQGESEIYIFNAQPSAFISDQDATERFVCVEAQNADISTYLDINQENNTKCKNIEGSGFAIVSVYPNPTDEDITISILLSETTSIYVELYDQTGRMVHKNLNEEMEPGIHDFNMPFSTFESGIYSLRVFDGNLTRVEKIIKR